MKKLIVLLLISNLTYSQVISTPTTKIGDTTRFNVSRNAINTYNHVFADLNACNELADSLSSEIKTLNDIQINDNKIIDRQDIQIYNLDEQLKQTNIIVGLNDKQLKRANRRIKFQKIIIYLTGTLVIFETGYIAVLKSF